MYPDNTHHQAPASSAPDSLPQVQATGFQPQPVQQPFSAIPAGGAMPEEKMADQVKRLARQYAANPFAFNGAFQQLKSQYLLEHYNIDPNADKK
jgi:hypothetical protein